MVITIGDLTARRQADTSDFTKQLRDAEKGLLTVGAASVALRAALPPAAAVVRGWVQRDC